MEQYYGWKKETSRNIRLNLYDQYPKWSGSRVDSTNISIVVNDNDPSLHGPGLPLTKTIKAAALL